jgi:hypothetical protein
MKQLLASSLVLCSLVACSDSPTAPSSPPQTQYTLSTVASPSVGGSVGISPNQTEHSPGTTVTLTASPAPGYRFLQWAGDAYGSDNPISVVVDANYFVTATFVSTPAQPLWRGPAR